MKIKKTLEEEYNIKNLNNEINKDLIINFVYDLNNILAYSSNYTPKTKASIKNEIDLALENETINLQTHEDKIIGLIMWFENYDHNLCDVSIFVDKDDINYLETTEKLIRDMKKKINPIFKLNFFFPIENTRMSKYLDNKNAKRNVNEYILELFRGNEKNLVEWNDIQEINTSSKKSYIKLHEDIFPDSYISGLEVVRNLSDNRYVYIYMPNNVAIGFVILRVDSVEMATVEFLGVKEGYRGNGIGREILSFIIEISFNVKNYSKLNLVVDSDNEKAIWIYQSMGFELKTENHSYTL